MSEMIVIFLVAFLIVGPSDMSKVARALGRFVRYIRNMLDDVKRETGFDEVEKEDKQVQREVTQTVKQADIGEEIRQTRREMSHELREVERMANQAKNPDTPPEK